MPEATYLPERQTEYWTSREIEEFLLDAGYSVIAIPLSQAIEHHIPSDFLYVDQQRLKVFRLGATVKQKLKDGSIILPSQPSPLDTANFRLAQRYLKRLGYYQGDETGLWMTRFIRQ